MAAGKLSPRQKMINMMYLVLTALLALNVSKEVLNSFFEVNLGIVKTTESLSDKNNDIYSDFTNATNQVKVKPYKDLAFQIKPESDKLVEMIQEMKYSLVLSVDKKVYLGQYLDDEGEPIEDNAMESEYADLTPSQKKMKIAELSNKEDRDASSDLFNPENKQGAARILDKNGNGLATQLRGNVESFRVLLSNILKTAEDSSWIKQGSSESLIDDLKPQLEMAFFLIVYCNGGDCEDSLHLASDLGSLYGLPPENIYVYEGGFNEWKEMQMPITVGTEVR